MPGPPAMAASAAVAVLLGVLVLLLTTGGGGSNPAIAGASRARYGGLPSWLPKPKVRVDRLLHASASHPALSIQGEPISVTLANATVTASAVGPEVPEEGRFPVPPVTPTTFVVSFSAPSRAIPLHASSFELLDERGRIHHPKVTDLGGGAPPSTIVPGHPISVRLHAILPTGDGGLTWAPEGGSPIATWDYTVEIDCGSAGGRRRSIDADPALAARSLYAAGWRRSGGVGER